MVNTGGRGVVNPTSMLFVNLHDVELLGAKWLQPKDLKMHCKRLSKKE